MSPTPSQQDLELSKVIGAETAKSRMSTLLRWLLAMIAFAGIAVGGYLFFNAGARVQEMPQYRTEMIGQGDLRVTVSATGKLAPVNEVDVGSEQSGTIKEVFVDYNDRVKEGQVLARLDITKLQDAIAKAKAALASAEAKVLQAVATVKESRANLGRLQQVAKLSGGRVPSRSELETAEATLQRAIADEASARAAVDEARAALRSNETDLAKASIYSPIDGVVLARSVEPGQTVAASLQVTVLFTLAENLAQMELQVDVDEADVGQVRAGQSATFTVDAYPNRKFPARISLVRFGSETVDNVVSYKTILNVDNDDLSLRPGMTATAEIVTAERQHVLLIPNAALRFTPPKPATDTSPKSGGGLLASLLPRPPRQDAQKVVTETIDKNAAQRVWVLRDGQPVSVTVTVGQSDGRMTEITSGDLQAGAAVITASVSAKR